MDCDLFLRIHYTDEIHLDYSIHKRNTSGRLRLSSLQKMTVAYGVTTDLMDEYVRIRESTAQLSMK